MLKKCLILFLSLFLLSQVQAREIKGVTFFETINYGQTPLLLNGAGVRTKLFFDIYAIGLYTTEKMHDASALIQQAKPRRVRISLLHKVEAESICSSLMNSLEHNVSAAELVSLKPYIEQTRALFKRSGTLQKGDTVVLDIVPDIGLQVSIKGQEPSTIASERFAQGMLSIWLGEHPVDKKLKHVLLGDTEV